MSTITKERIELFIKSPLDNGLTRGEQMEVARIALASLEAKSRKLFTCSGCGTEGLDEPLESKCHCNEDGAHWVESVVYTAPPAPVSVPPAIHDDDFEEALSVLNDTLDDCGDSERGLLLALDRAGIEVRSDACRAAMLQGDEPVTDNTNQQFESLSRGDK